MIKSRFERYRNHTRLLLAIIGLASLGACGGLGLGDADDTLTGDIESSPETAIDEGVEEGAPPVPDAAGTATVTAMLAELAERDTCVGPEGEALGMGLTEFESLEAMQASLPNEMLYPDLATIPDGFEFVKAYYNAGMVSDVFKQSTMGILFNGEGGEGVSELSVLYYSQARPLPQPPREEHEVVEVRGHETYLFEPPFRETLLSIQWLEDCRYVSVIGDVDQETLFSIAESLGPAGAGN